MTDDEQVRVPLKAEGEITTEPSKETSELPPAYESPTINFNDGWKDRPFAILFYIHILIVIILASVLGVPSVWTYLKARNIDQINELLADADIKPFVLGFITSLIVAVLTSILMFLMLKLCKKNLIMTTFIMIILFQISAIIVLGFIFWPLCFIPGFFLSITLIFFACIRKRISFSEAHLQAGCAALSTHGSLIIVAVFMIFIEIIWFIVWSLMSFGLTQTIFSQTKELNETLTNIGNQTEELFQLSQQNTTNNSTGTKNSTGRKIFSFILLVSWYWGAVVFSNIGHFVSACSVGHWWFPEETNKQYQMSTSIKRAFTKNFGTICLGSLLEAIVRALRRLAGDKKKKNFLSCIVECILSLIEKLIGYLNQWAFIYSALTGQSFVEASRSFVNLMKRRGWDVIMNDTIIGSTLTMINLSIGIFSAVCGGLIISLLIDKTPEYIVAAVIIVILCFVLGIMISSIISSILISCVRSVFLCFALNPSALAATHPKHLQDLSTAWNKYYPDEFAACGYSDSFMKENTV